MRTPGHPPRRHVSRGAGRALCIAILLLGGGACLADDTADETPAEDTAADDDALDGAVVGNVEIRVGDIFDPEADGENRLVFRLANRLHRETRERAIRNLLLFRTGDDFSGRRVEESERILRQTGYLYDADIETTPRDDGTVDVVVNTRDVWTLSVGVGFGRAGGENSSHFGLEDRNFLGWGKRVQVERSSNVDRTSTLFAYDDPALFGSRLRFGVQHSDNSDGAFDAFHFERPFYSLDTPWAAGVSAVFNQREDSLYDLGEITNRFAHDVRSIEAYGGIGRLRSSRTTHRFRAGFTYRTDTFSAAFDPSASVAIPGDRTLAYPWVEYERVRDGFVEVHDLDRIHRTEDLNLGGRMRVRLGWSAPTWGADESESIVEFDASHGLRLGDGRFLVLGTHAAGRVGQGGAHDALAGGSLRYYRRVWGRHVFYVGLEGDVASRLDPEHQLLIGGDTGLRGYPLRYQPGDRRVLLTVEQRLFTDWHPLRLLRIGAAAFADVGRAWFSGSDVGGPDRGWLRDVGVGLRLGSSRSATGEMIHIDLAMPLDGNDSISNFQVLVTTKQSF